MTQSSTERQRKMRERRKALGLRRLEIWAHPEDAPEIQKAADAMAAERQRERPATAKEVREHYKAKGLEVVISREGAVKYRKAKGEPWLDGRWVEEYRYSEPHGVRL